MKTLAPSILIVAAATLTPFSPAAADTLTWSLADNGNWDTTSENWAGTSATWVNGNDAVFAGATGYTITLTAAVEASSVTINDNGNWTFTGLGNLSTTTITKNGTGQLLIGSGDFSSFAGNINLVGGVLRLAGGTTLGNGTGSITLNAGSRLALDNVVTLDKELVLNGGIISMRYNGSSIIKSTISGSGDLLINDSSEAYGNGLSFQRASLDYTYTGDTYIARNYVEYRGYNATNFNPFGTNASATVYLRSQAGSYNPATTVVFNPSATSSTYYIAQGLNISANDGRPVVIEHRDGTLRFTGNIALNTDATSTITFVTQYSGKNLYLDGILSGTGSTIITDISGNYGSGWVSLTNNGNNFSGTYTVNNSRGHYGILSLDADNAASNAQVILSNGHLRIAAANATVAGLSGESTTSTVYNADATARTFTVNTTGDNTFTGSIGNNTANGDRLSLVKNGTGTLTLSGTNTYTGATLIEGGTLIIADTGSINASSGIRLATESSVFDTQAFANYTLGTGQTLSGNGIVITGGTLTVAGTLAPGNSIGTLAVVGNVVLQEGATLLFEIGTGGAQDSLNFILPGSTLTLEGDVTLVLAVAEGALQQNYSLFGGSGLTIDGPGAFNVSFSGTEPDFWDWNPLNGTFTIVPEPSTYALWSAIGVTGLITLRRRRTK